MAVESKESRLFVTAVLVSLSVVLHFFRVPYPLMQALKFDLVGLPLLVIAYYSLAHLLAALPVVWVGIALISQDWIGATMKVLAEASTALPFSVALRWRRAGRIALAASALLPTVSRIAVMSLANYLVLPRWALLAGWVNTLEEGVALAKVSMPLIASFNAILGLAVCSAGYSSIQILRRAGILP